MIIYTDENGKRNYMEDVNRGREQANLILKAWNKLPLQDITEPDQVTELINTSDVKHFAVKMLPPQQEPVKLFGVVLKPGRVLELMDIDFAEIQAAISMADKQLIWKFIEVAKVNKANGIEVNKNKLMEKLKDFDLIAVTQRQKEIAVLYRQVVEGLQKLIEMGVVKQDSILRNAPAKNWLSRNGNQVDIMPEYFQKISRE